MEINISLTKQIDEARYLTADNAWRYRVILRYFYLEYEKMSYYMYKEDVFEELKKHPEFSQYTMDNCKQDLDVLVSWKNLIPVQDTSKAATVEEFKNKQFRYQLSEYSVEIERMAIRLENLHIESASLEPSLLERIKQELRKFNSMADKDEREVGMWWSSLNSDFRRLNQNYQDYIRELYGAKADELMRTNEFLVFKDKFIDYLRDFVKTLQNNSYAIEEIIRSIDKTTEKIVMDKVFEYEKSIPRLDFNISLEAVRESINGRWKNLKYWFLGDEGRQSESAKLFDITNEIIRKITRFAFQISETMNAAANRKEEYKKLCQMFLNCKDIKEAHKLSATVFGIFNTRHIKYDFERKTESINSGVYDEEPCVITIKPRIRNYREKSQRSVIVSRKEEKERLLQSLIEKRQEEQSIIESYIKDGKIDFASLPIIDAHVRAAFLRWLGKGLINADKKAKTEDGRVYHIIEAEDSGRCVLECTDGSFEMPHYIIVFE